MTGCMYLPAPVVDRVFIVDLFTHVLDQLGRRANFVLRLLFFQHLVKNGLDPLLKQSVVLVGDEKIADSVYT